MITLDEFRSLVSSYMALKGRWRLSSVMRERNHRAALNSGMDVGLVRAMSPFMPFHLLIAGNELSYEGKIPIRDIGQAIEGTILNLTSAYEFPSMTFSGMSGDMQVMTEDMADEAMANMFLDRFDTGLSSMLSANQVIDGLANADVDKAMEQFYRSMEATIDMRNPKRNAMLILRSWLEEPVVFTDQNKRFHNFKSISYSSSLYPLGKTLWGYLEGQPSFSFDAQEWRNTPWSFTFKVVKEARPDFVLEGNSSPSNPQPGSSIIVPFTPPPEPQTSNPAPDPVVIFETSEISFLVPGTSDRLTSNLNNPGDVVSVELPVGSTDTDLFFFIGFSDLVSRQQIESGVLFFDDNGNELVVDFTPSSGDDQSQEWQGVFQDIAVDKNVSIQISPNLTSVSGSRIISPSSAIVEVTELQPVSQGSVKLASAVFEDFDAADQSISVGTNLDFSSSEPIAFQDLTLEDGAIGFSVVLTFNLPCAPSGVLEVRLNGASYTDFVVKPLDAENPTQHRVTVTQKPQLQAGDFSIRINPGVNYSDPTNQSPEKTGDPSTSPYFVGVSINEVVPPIQIDESTTLEAIYVTQHVSQSPMTEQFVIDDQSVVSAFTGTPAPNIQGADSGLSIRLSPEVDSVGLIRFSGPVENINDQTVRMIQVGEGEPLELIEFTALPGGGAGPSSDWTFRIKTPVEPPDRASYQLAVYGGEFQPDGLVLSEASRATSDIFPSTPDPRPLQSEGKVPLVKPEGVSYPPIVSYVFNAESMSGNIELVDAKWFIEQDGSFVQNTESSLTNMGSALRIDPTVSSNLIRLELTFSQNIRAQDIRVSALNALFLDDVFENPSTSKTVRNWGRLVNVDPDDPEVSSSVFTYEISLLQDKDPRGALRIAIPSGDIESVDGNGFMFNELLFLVVIDDPDFKRLGGLSVRDFEFRSGGETIGLRSEYDPENYVHDYILRAESFPQDLVMRTEFNGSVPLDQLRINDNVNASTIKDGQESELSGSWGSFQDVEEGGRFKDLDFNLLDSPDQIIVVFGEAIEAESGKTTSSTHTARIELVKPEPPPPPSLEVTSRLTYTPDNGPQRSREATLFLLKSSFLNNAVILELIFNLPSSAKMDVNELTPGSPNAKIRFSDHNSSFEIPNTEITMLRPTPSNQTDARSFEYRLDWLIGKPPGSALNITLDSTLSPIDRPEMIGGNGKTILIRAARDARFN